MQRLQQRFGMLVLQFTMLLPGLIQIPVIEALPHLQLGLIRGMMMVSDTLSESRFKEAGLRKRLASHWTPTNQFQLVQQELLYMSRMPV